MSTNMYVEAMAKAQAMAKEHVGEACAELIEWATTSILPNGRVREIAEVLQGVSEYQSLTLAQTLVQREALKYVVEKETQ
ncbi:hypothetical protein [Dyella telluris]|uniref:Uncharacterized protein n=1 Tax=Dyella telluris TaxID=2763498 RepID=A0A7G8Q4P4_9GAMM|nr:hypothetical protein [Dyella telluris]QNK01752.1 hypothetical protein H8F01_00800 [Dyella telluris]